MKVVAVKTCYTSDNKRKRPGEKFTIKSAKEFSYIGMALLDKGKEVTFDNEEELEKYLKKSSKPSKPVEKPKADMEVVAEQESPSEQEVI